MLLFFFYHHAGQRQSQVFVLSIMPKNIDVEITMKAIDVGIRQ